MQQARYGHAMVGYQRQLYVFGGRNRRSALSSVECYDVHKNEWTSVAPLSEARDCLGKETSQINFLNALSTKDMT